MYFVSFSAKRSPSLHQQLLMACRTAGFAPRIHQEAAQLQSIMSLVAAGLALWMTSERPAGLISSDGVLVGLMGPEGRALSAPRHCGSLGGKWLPMSPAEMVASKASVRA